MFGKSIKLFTIFGFRVSIDLSWLIILALVVWSLGGLYFPEQYPGLHWSVYLAMGLAAALGLFLSIIFHELCHSLVARRYGLPMKGITLFIFGGVAEMSEEPPSAKAEILMAIAGPISSAVVAGVFFGISKLGASVGWPETITLVLGWIAMINAILVAFNMIPGFPLDGGRVLRGILWSIKGDLRKATYTASRVGAGFGAVLIGLGIVWLFLTGAIIAGVWWILIGLFIRGAAKQGYQQVIIRQSLEGEPVRRFMTDRPVSVPPDVKLDEFVEDYVYHHHFKMFPVSRNGDLQGCVTTRRIKEIPREQWPQTTVGEAAEQCDETNTIDADEDAMTAMTVMNTNEASRLMVVDRGELVGIISLKDLMKFLSLKMELEGGAEVTPPSLPGPKS